MSKSVSLRYQMRGLGIGILVTALLMGVGKEDKIPLNVDKDSQKLTDLQNAVRPTGAQTPDSSGAGQDATGESGSGPETDDGTASGGESGTGDGTEPGGESGTGDGTEPGGESGTGDGTEPGGESGTGDGTEPGGGTGTGGGTEPGGESGESASATSGGVVGQDGTSVTVRIVGGMASDAVSELIAEAGLVEDAAAFDRYLCENGEYSRKIQEGIFTIPLGATEKEIAVIITRGK